MQYVPILGPWGQLLLLILACILAYFTWRQRQWRSTAEAAQTELIILRARDERLSKENRELLTEIATLKARTDLKPIVDAFNAWTNESRGHFLQAMERLEEIHSEQSGSTAKVVDHLTSLTDQVVAMTSQISRQEEVLRRNVSSQ
jgi:hypothetical protein